MQRTGHVADKILTENTSTVMLLHGSSVGETTSAIAAAKAIIHDKSVLPTTFLFTASSVSAARLLADRMKFLRSKYPQHKFASQLLPIDNVPYMSVFLHKLRPSVAILLESEIWPNFMACSKQLNIPVGLLDGKISRRSAHLWGYVGESARRHVFGAFECVSAQSSLDAERLAFLGAKCIKLAPSLKFASDPGTVSAPLQDSLLESIISRSAWIAASTHEGEEELVLSAHKMVLKKHIMDQSLLILVPRHPFRAAQVYNMAIYQHGFSKEQVVLRSQQISIPRASSVCIVDSLGELPEFYKLAKIAFVANSLLPTGQGHNFAEAAHCGVPVVLGPFLGHFTALRDAVLAELSQRVVSEVAVEPLASVGNEEELALRVHMALVNPDLAVHQGQILRSCVADLGNRASHQTRDFVQQLSKSNTGQFCD